jgi:COP9 signalosome complex subunit 3
MSDHNDFIARIVALSRNAIHPKELQKLQHVVKSEGALLAAMGTKGTGDNFESSILMDYAKLFNKEEELFPLSILFLCMQNHLMDEKAENLQYTWLSIATNMFHLINSVRDYRTLSNVFACYHREVSQIILTIAKYAIKLGQSKEVIYALEVAADITQPNNDSSSNSCLTAAHVAFVQVCNTARMYKYASTWIQKNPILAINPTEAYITTEDYLVYHYHASLTFIAQKEYNLAMECLNNCITIPSVAPSEISLLAIRTAMFVSLLHNGQPYILPNFVSSCVKQACETSIIPYKRIQDIFLQGDSSNLKNAIELNEDILSTDHNYGLAHALVDAQARHNMRKLTDTYITLSLTDMATNLGLSTSGEAEVMLCELILSGAIAATIDKPSGMVHFEDKIMDNKAEKELMRSLKETMNLNNQLETMKKQLYISPLFIQSLTTSSSSRSPRSIYDGSDDVGDMEELLSA